MWWTNILEWNVVAFAIGILLSIAIGVMSMAPPEFLVAKICFSLAALMCAARLGFSLAYADYQPWLRLGMGLVLFGVIGVGWTESWRWVKGRQPIVVTEAEVGLRHEVVNFIETGEHIRDDFIDEARRRAHRELNDHLFLHRRVQIEAWRNRVALTLDGQRVLRPEVRLYVMTTSGDRISEAISRLRDVIRDWDHWRR